MSFGFQVFRPGVLPCGWIFIHGGDTAGGTRESGMVLSGCRLRENPARENAAAAIWQKEVRQKPP
jgi:hypothetical protein